MIGVDEVGRGCWAGPLLVVAARATGALPSGLKDSKLLSRSQREIILNKLSICCKFGEGWVSCTEIDNVGLSRALTVGAQRALQQLGAADSDQIILDGKYNYLPKKYNKSVAKVAADNSVPIVSAASIYAKVRRDKYMSELAKEHPLYNFEKHVGYGTAQHRLAIKTYGIIKNVHRLSYKPLGDMAS